MTTQSRIVEVFSVVVLIAGFLIVPDAKARPPRAREAVAVIQVIDHSERILSLNHQQGRGPRELVWNSDTKFLRDWRFVPATELKEGTLATVYYHSPFFGKPFVTKVVWTNQY